MTETSIERILEIESERDQTMGDPEFQQWMKDLGVSIIYKSPEPILNARDAMREYDFSRLFSRRSIFNIFK